MCLQVSSASSGPRHRDSSFTLENSSLWGRQGEGDTAYTPGSGLVRTRELLHSLQNRASEGLTQQGLQTPRLSLGLCLSLTTEANAGNDREWSGETHRSG